MSAARRGTSRSALPASGPPASVTHVSVWSTSRWRAAAAGALLTGLALSQGTVSSAAFLDRTGNGGDSWTAASLQPPGGLSATQVCTDDPVPVHRSTATGTDNGANPVAGRTTLTVSRPAGALAGHLLVAQIAFAGGPLPGDVTAPAGWTPLGVLQQDGVTQGIYYRWATTSDAASWGWAHPAAHAVGAITAYSGVHPEFPINAFTGQLSDGSKEVVAPSVTTTTPNSLVLTMYGRANASTWLQAAGMTERWDLDSSVVSVSGADTGRPSAGATGSRTAESTNGGLSLAHSLALRPSATPSVSLSWSATPSTIATGYRVRRLVDGTVQHTQTVAGRTTTTATDGPLVNGTAHRFEVAAGLDSWVSDPASTTVTPDC